MHPTELLLVALFSSLLIEEFFGFFRWLNTRGARVYATAPSIFKRNTRR